MFRGTNNLLDLIAIVVVIIIIIIIVLFLIGGATATIRKISPREGPFSMTIGHV